MKGLIGDDILKIDILETDVEILKNTPASYLGSCRYRLRNFFEAEKDYEKILKEWGTKK